MSNLINLTDQVCCRFAIDIDSEFVFSIMSETGMVAHFVNINDHSKIRKGVMRPGVDNQINYTNENILSMLRDENVKLLKNNLMKSLNSEDFSLNDLDNYIEIVNENVTDDIKQDYINRFKTFLLSTIFQFNYTNK